MGVGHSNYILTKEIYREEKEKEKDKTLPKETKREREIRVARLRQTLKLLKIEKDILDKNSREVLRLKKIKLEEKKKSLEKKKSPQKKQIKK